MPVQHLCKRRIKIVPLKTGSVLSALGGRQTEIAFLNGLPVNEWVIVSMERYKTIFTGKHRLNLKEYKAIRVPGRFSHPCLGVFHPRMIGLPRSHIHGVIEMRSLHGLITLKTYLYLFCTYLCTYIIYILYHKLSCS